MDEMNGGFTWDSLCVAVVKIQADIRDIRATMDAMATKKDVGRILAAISAFARKAGN